MANVHTFNGSHKVRDLITSAAQGTLNTAWVSPFATSGSAGDADRAAFFLKVGTVAAGTVDMALFQAQDAAGTGAKAITGATLTQINATNDEGLKSIEIGPGALDGANGFTHVQVRVTVSTGTPIYGVFQINHRLRYPGTGGQDETYDEAVIVLG